VGGEGGISNRVHLGEGERRLAARGERGRRFLAAKGSNIKLRIIGKA
jgi:hypothetical protein